METLKDKFTNRQRFFFSISFSVSYLDLIITDQFIVIFEKTTHIIIKITKSNILFDAESCYFILHIMFLARGVIGNLRLICFYKRKSVTVIYFSYNL